MHELVWPQNGLTPVEIHCSKMGAADMEWSSGHRQRPYADLGVERADQQGAGEEALLRAPLVTAVCTADHVHTQQSQHTHTQQPLERERETE